MAQVALSGFVSYTRNTFSASVTKSPHKPSHGHVATEVTQAVRSSLQTHCSWGWRGRLSQPPAVVALSHPLRGTELSRAFLSSVSLPSPYPSCFLHSSPSPSQSRIVSAPHTWGRGGGLPSLHKLKFRTDSTLAFPWWILFLLIVLTQPNL